MLPLNPLPGVETNVYCFTGLLVCWFASCVAAVWLLCFDDVYLVAGVTSYMLARSSVRHLLRSYAPHVQICCSTRLSKYTYNETTSAGIHLCSPGCGNDVKMHTFCSPGGWNHVQHSDSMHSSCGHDIKMHIHDAQSGGQGSAVSAY